MGACVYEDVTKLKLLPACETAETAIDNVDDVDVDDDDVHNSK